MYETKDASLDMKAPRPVITAIKNTAVVLHLDFLSGNNLLFRFTFLVLCFKYTYFPSRIDIKNRIYNISKLTSFFQQQKSVKFKKSNLTNVIF